VDLSQFFIMRHEVLLLAVIILILLMEIFVGKANRKAIIPVSIGLFLLSTLAGFLPAESGQLFGDMYRTNGLIVSMKNILNIGVLIVMLLSAEWLRKEENLDKVSEYYLIMLSTLVGMFYMISSGDFLMFYLGLELASIPMAALAAYDKFRNSSAEAGIKFIFSSALSSGVLLYGLSMIYASTGSIYFTEVAAHMGEQPLQVLGFIFFLAGMGFKISLVPFHFWTADVYEGAPISVTSYLSVISKGAAIFIFSIVLFSVFPMLEPLWQELLYVLAILTMTLANLFAVRQNNIKRFLAFSSIAQAGFILLGIMGGPHLGLTTVVYFILVYVFTNLGAFGVAISISDKTGKENINDYNGLYKTNPMLSLTMMLALFSLAGIPPVAGFFGKFFLFTSAASKGYYILVLIAVLNATISLYYYLRVVKAMFIEKSDHPIAPFRSSLSTRMALALCVAGTFAVGFISWIYEYLYDMTYLLFIF